MAALGQLDLPRVAHPFLVDLAAETGGAALLLVRQADRAQIVDKVDAGHVAVEVSATVGRRIPLAAGACGKVFLAYLSPDERTQHLKGLGHVTTKTIRDANEYANELEKVRQRGYATDDEEYLPGVRATSAPIFDARQHLVGAVLVVGLTTSVSPEDLGPSGEATARTARAISAALGAD
jgi:DNA-binding IclR family transcriptional regulator